MPYAFLPGLEAIRSPTLKAEQGGHYSAFVSSGNVGHIGGEQLVRQTLQHINGMFAN